MWRSIRSGRATACLGIARGAVAFVGGAGATPQVEVFDMPSNASLHLPALVGAGSGHGLPSAIGRAIKAAGRACAGARFVIGNDLACHWLLAPPTGASSLREIQAVAQARFAELFDERPDEWLVTGDWRTGQPFICTAVPKWVAAAVHAAAPDVVLAVCEGTLLSRAFALFHRQLPDDGWCCIHSPRSLALMHLRAGLPVSLRVVPVVEGAPRGGVFTAGAEALQREAARQALAPVVKATWLDLAASDHREARTPRSDHAGIALRVLRLHHGRHMTKLAAGAAAEASAAALLCTGSGVSVT